MDQQTDAPEGLGPSPVPPKLVLSNEVRASLEAVRVAQEAARVRARQQTLTTRVWFAATVAMLAAGGFALAPRVARWRHGRVQATPVARPAPTPAELTVSPTPPPAPAAAVVPPKAAALPEVAPTPKTAPSPAAAPAPEHRSATADSGCDTALIRSAPWRLSPEACTRVFEANPNDPRLALAIAHAEHVRGHFAESAQWATRALALDPATAEAYVLIARAHADGGRQEEARAAYRRYLELAPRGWHKAEARSAIDRADQTTPPALPAAR